MGVEGMRFPVQCRHCGLVHDGALVEVVQRFTDCSVWRCPGCTILIDDRPPAWGGSYKPGDRQFSRPEQEVRRPVDDKYTVHDPAEAAALPAGTWVVDPDGKPWCLIDTHMGFPQRMAMQKRLLLDLESLTYPLQQADFEGDCVHRWGTHEMGQCIRCGQVVAVPRPVQFTEEQLGLFRAVAEMNARHESNRTKG